MGQLGLGIFADVGSSTLPSSASLVEVGGEAVLRVAAALNHTCALLEQGTVRCWGRSLVGALGRASNETIGDDELPIEIEPVNLGGFRAIDIAAENEHTCAILQNGTLRCWGSNLTGELGVGSTWVTGDNEMPDEVPAVTFEPSRGVQLALGGSHSCVLLDTGKVRCWGENRSGQLGLGSTEDLGDNELPSSAAPVNLGCGRAVQVAAGQSHSCAVMSDGSVRCWGLGRLGALGLGSQEALGDDESPKDAVPVELGAPAMKVAAGLSHSCALLVTGEVRCWGSNDYGETGLGRIERIGDDELPLSVPIVSLGAQLVVDISAEANHTCVLLDTDEVRCWGANAFGQLGLGHTETIGDNELPSSVPPVQL